MQGLRAQLNPCILLIKEGYVLFETDRINYSGEFTGFHNYDGTPGSDTSSERDEYFVAGAEIYKDVGD